MHAAEEAAGASGSVPALAQLGIGPSLDRLPDDVLLQVSHGAEVFSLYALEAEKRHTRYQIWTLLDEPASFAQTCKHLAGVSRDPSWRATWFMQHFTRYEVIFYAIARPKVFDSRLLDSLMARGATLSRHLVQLLHHLHDRTSLITHYPSRWGSRLSFSTYVAVLEKARRIYGDAVSFHASDVDDRTFQRLGLATHYDAQAEIPPALSSIVGTFRFMPLPLGFGDGFSPQQTVKQTQGNSVELALTRLPGLAPLMLANGEC